MIASRVCLPEEDVVAILRHFGVRTESINAFLQQQITSDLWPDLTHEHLKKLGVAAFGPRKKLLTWIHLHMVPEQEQDQERVKTAQNIESMLFVPNSMAKNQQTGDSSTLVTEPTWSDVAKNKKQNNTICTTTICTAVVMNDDGHAATASANRSCTGKTMSTSSIKIRHAHKSMLDTLFTIVCDHGENSINAQVLAKQFHAGTGKSPQSVFGEDWLTDVKADPRLHYDGRQVIAIRNIRGTRKAETIARYNINALPHTGIDHRAVADIFHLAGLCLPCRNCSENRARPCTYCHHPEHGFYSQESFDERLSKAVCSSPKNGAMLVRRKQVFACLKELRICDRNSLRHIARWLGV